MNKIEAGDKVVLRDDLPYNKGAHVSALGPGPYVVERVVGPRWIYIKDKPCPHTKWYREAGAWALCRFKPYVEETRVKVGEKYKFIGATVPVIVRSVQDGFVVYSLDWFEDVVGAKKIDDFLIQAHQYVEPPHVIKIGDKFHPDRRTRDFQIIGEVKNCEIAGEVKDWWICLPDARYGNPVPYLRSKDNCPVDWLVKP